MKYRGIELKEITAPQICNPPKQMLVWDDTTEEPVARDVYAIVDRGPDGYPVIAQYGSFRHCAEIPETKLATNRELARWLSGGNGEVKGWGGDLVTHTWLAYPIDDADKSVPEKVFVRAWDDEDWHAPTREYLGLAGK